MMKKLKYAPYVIFGVMIYGSVGACDTDLISFEQFLQQITYCVLGICITMLIQKLHKKRAAKEATKSTN